MRVNLIPMAGEGQRYKNEGYSVPKPLIDIDGVPMVVRAARALPEADRYIFVCRREHIAEAGIDKVLTSYFKDAVVISIDELTEGQAMTCMLAREYISDDDLLTIGACDNDMTYDMGSLQFLLQDAATEALIWTFRHNPVVAAHPEMYGWVRANASGEALQVSCKKPISTEPLNDPAIIGTFTFKRADIFFNAVERMVAANERINNEFYVDVAADYAIRNGHKVMNFEVAQYIGWGVPSDLKTYLYWKSYFRQRTFK